MRPCDDVFIGGAETELTEEILQRFAQGGQYGKEGPEHGSRSELYSVYIR
jgi:hypothetical protein